VSRRAARAVLPSLLLAFMLGVVATRLWDRFGPGRDLALATFEAAYQITRARYVEKDKTNPRDLVYNAITGMVQGLGDTGHSRFLTPEQRRREQQSLSGVVVGIGVEMAERDGRPVVVSTYPGSPAARAGIRAGDRIIRVNGEDVSALGLSQLAERLRGPAGSDVRLTVLHPDGAVLEVAVRREELHIPFVTWAPLSGGLWHIRIAGFGAGTAAQLDQALAAAQAAGARGIVLDLRDNPGGLLDEAVAVASRFLTEGVVLIERDRDGHTTPVRVQDEAPHTTLPVVLLINGGTASAAEVVAAALLDHGRAVAVGERTFGTGTVLQTFALPDGSALLLGVREWLTPSGEPLRNRGVTPTETVSLPAQAEPLVPRLPASAEEQPCAAADAQLRAAVARLGVACPT
jgi:carboxyl-terminal processing protease